MRLRPLTDNVPKPMVDFRGVPLLEYTLSILPKQVSEVIIVVGYLSNKIVDYFGRSFSGRPIQYILQPEAKGTFHALKQAKDTLGEEEFMVVSGDDIYSAKDLEDVALSHYLSVLATVTAQPERFGICKSNGEGFLEEIIEKPSVFCGNLANIGVYKLDAAIFKEPTITGPNGEELLAPMIGTLAKSRKIELVRAFFWHPIADLNDWEKAQKITF